MSAAAATPPASSAAAAPLPLAGVRVLDLTRLLPGNAATLVLAGLGADVVKVEDPRFGDGTRLAPPYAITGESGPHLALNRGKRSLAVDLKHPEGRALLLDLVAHAEVLVDSFRPGVLDRLGLGADALAAANPALVHVSITAYGDGGMAALPGHDLNAEGYAGLLSLARGPDGAPAMPAVPVADLTAALQAVVAVLAGLRRAESGGGGLRADVPMVDAALTLATMLSGTVAVTGAAPPSPEVLSGALACYRPYRCADGQWVVCAGLEPKFFGRTVELLGRPDLAARQYDPAGQDDLAAELAELFGALPRAEVLALLEHDDTCVSPVHDVAEAMAAAEPRGSIVRVRLADGTPVPVISAVPWLPGAGAGDGSAAPALGADTEAVLAELGLDAARVAGLREAGVVA